MNFSVFFYLNKFHLIIQYHINFSTVRSLENEITDQP